MALSPFRHLIAGLVFASAAVLDAQAQSAFIRLKVQQQDSAQVAAFDSAGKIYLSLNDFCAALRLPCVVNDSTEKLEFLYNSQLIKFSSGSPFVVITERSTNDASVYQLAAAPVERAGAFYVSVEPFVRFIDRIWEKGAIWQTDNTISLGNPSTNPFDLTGLTVEKKINGYLLTLHSQKKIPEFENWLKPDGWLFLTIPNMRADTATLQATKPNGPLRKVLVFQSPTAVQLTLKVTSDVEHAEVTEDPASNNLMISLRTRDTETKKPELKPQPPAAAAARKELQQTRDRWKLDVIVLDAGHGGRDPGTIGVTKVREKDVTLGITLKLGELLEKNLKGVKVVYTRKSDKFMELYKRTQIANEAEGKLFVSVHCNSTDRKPSSANGFEIYLLRPGKTEEAVRAASRENAVIQFEEDAASRYRQLTEEEFIIVTMHQSSYVKYSEQFAETALMSMGRHLSQKNSGVKQAGFYVLVGASMPNVLIETGYLSNRKEEAMLKSQEGQRRIAAAIFQGIKEYKRLYEATLLEGRSTGGQ